jgi:hypothetical protein
MWAMRCSSTFCCRRKQFQIEGGGCGAAAAAEGLPEELLRMLLVDIALAMPGALIEPPVAPLLGALILVGTSLSPAEPLAALLAALLALNGAGKPFKNGFEVERSPPLIRAVLLNY